jgi:hypothetical protein
MGSVFDLVLNETWSVAVAVTPLVVVFLVFQALVLRLPAREIVQVLSGTVVAAAGLVLFLVGVGLAFLPFGRLIGEAMTTLANPVPIFLIGFALGFVTSWGEPAVRILANEIESASSGYLHSKIIVVAICSGVAVVVGVGLLFNHYLVPLSYLLIVGYGVAVAAIFFTEKGFVGIAADAGGVATGPLSNSFLLALAIGAASTVHSQNSLMHGFGLVALVALAPILAIMVLGMLMRWKSRTGKKT